MKNYNIKLTTTELQKLEIFLVMYENKLLDESEANRIESENFNYEYSQKARDALKSNAIWFKETYEVIHKIREKLNTIPF